MKYTIYNLIVDVFKEFKEDVRKGDLLLELVISLLLINISAIIGVILIYLPIILRV